MRIDCSPPMHGCTLPAARMRQDRAPMNAGEIPALAAAGLGAGAINVLVGSGTLITFPVLLAVGYSPVTANVSNSLGLVPGSLTGAVAYRRELAGQGARALRLGAAALAGGITGAVALLLAPASAFTAIVPGFIALALVLTVAQPRIGRWLARRRIDLERHGSRLTPLAVYATGVYGGYFGAAQGIMLLAILGVALAQDLQRTNALKNVLAGLVNAVAGAYFVIAAHVAWGAAGLIAAGSIAGAAAGARYGRRLPPNALRAVVVAVGISAIVRLVTE
jgi:uncharacterized protein